MEQNSPLLLLFDIPQDQLRAELTDFIENDEHLQVDRLGHVDASAVTLLFQGLTVVCRVGGAPVDLSGYRKIFSTIAGDTVRSALDICLHVHVEGGMRIPEIAKLFLRLAALLSEGLGATAVVWVPSGLQSDPRYFAEVVESYSRGGVFPVLPIVDFVTERGQPQLCSKGLDLFAAQEFELSGPELDQQELIRRAIRLAHDIATNGAVHDAQDVPDIEPGNVIHLAPSASGELLECRIKSACEEVVHAA